MENLIQKFKIRVLSPDQRAEIQKMRLAMQDDLRNTPKEGTTKECLGKEYIVYPGVFWPHKSGDILLNNFVIRRGEEVLDLCTGCGVIAISAADKGAKRVVALDINPDAVRAAKENVIHYSYDEIIDVRLSDMFEALGLEEKFDVVTINPPFTDEKANDFAEATSFDTDFHVHKELFGKVGAHLKPNGRIYISQGNFGDIGRMLEMAANAGFTIKLVGREEFTTDPRALYVFELRIKE